MPILLTTAYNPGDLDAGTYTHVDVVHCNHRYQPETVSIHTMYGTLSGGDFVQGKATGGPFNISDDGGTDLTDLKALVSNASEPCADAWKRALCQWLIDKGHFLGSTV